MPPVIVEIKKLKPYGLQLFIALWKFCLLLYFRKLFWNGDGQIVRICAKRFLVRTSCTTHHCCDKKNKSYKRI